MSYDYFPAKREQSSANKNTSFRFRRLRIVLTLSKGTFSEGSNAIVIDDLAMKVKIQKLPFPDNGKCSAEIVGMRLQDMECLTTLGWRPMYHNRNYINIYAGDDESGLTEVFAGNITRAFADFNSAPDVPLKIEGQVGFFGRITAAGPTAIKGVQTVASFVKGQVEREGFTFENQGVSAQLRNCVFNGSPISQAYQAAHMVGAELILDDKRAILMPDGETVRGNAVLISPSTGMLKWPTITQNGIDVKTIFNPAYRFAGLVKIDTGGLIPKSDGALRIIKLSHSLSANDPKSGDWESTMTCFYPHLSGAIGRFI